MTSTVEYLGDLRTRCEHLKSGAIINTDAPTDNHGKGEAFSPTDLLATSLASCILSIMGIKAREKNIDMIGARAMVTKTMASNPRRISKIDITIEMPEIKYSTKEKRLLEKMAHHCPVKESLKNTVEESIEFVWK